MSLRRSARLGAIPSLTAPMSSSAPPPALKVTRVQHNNGITKPRKPTTKKATTKTPRSKHTTPPPPKSSTTTTTTTSSSYWDPTPTSTTTRPSTPPPLNRPVDPHQTNATLLTPHGSSINAYPITLAEASPSKTGLPRPTATTGTLLDQGLAHLIATDPRLKPVIEAHPCPLFSPAGLAEQVDPFNSLTSSIIGQQVSGAAAKSIRNKFVALFNLPGTAAADAGAGAGVEEGGLAHSRFPTPDIVARCDIPTLRTAGLSQRKAEYIQGLAEKFASGELSAKVLAMASDEELVERLTAVRGLGRWSVEMFACFALKRIDVFSTGDLGVQRGCAAFVGRDVGKLKGKGGGKFKYMSEKDMLELAAKFAPFRSLFMWYMWRIENVDVAVLTG